uniref:Domain of unknown function DB domain-containing protein n=1 Tax=Setaria digitata TaxID=48799 RepID=A0A915PUD0_9BILA
MFLQMDSCPLRLAADIHFCAAQGQDHRKCCITNGVTTTMAGKKCLVFCDQSVQHEIILDLSYLPCFERFDTIKHCFWRSARDSHLVEISKRFRINKWQSNSDHISETNPKQSSLSLNNYP